MIQELHHKNYKTTKLPTSLPKRASSLEFNNLIQENPSQNASLHILYLTLYFLSFVLDGHELEEMLLFIFPYHRKDHS